MKYFIFCLLISASVVSFAERYPVLDLKLTDREQLSVQTHTDFAMYWHFIEQNQPEQAAKYLLRALERQPQSVTLVESAVLMTQAQPSLIDKELFAIAEKHPEAILLNAGTIELLFRVHQPGKAKTLLEKTLAYCFDHAEMFQSHLHIETIAVLMKELLMMQPPESPEYLRRFRRRAETEFPIEQNLTYLGALLQYFTETEKNQDKFRETVQKLRAFLAKPGLNLSGNQEELLQTLVQYGEVLTAEAIAAEILLSRPESVKSLTTLMFLSHLKGDTQNEIRAATARFRMGDIHNPVNQAAYASALVENGESELLLALLEQAVGDGADRLVSLAATAALQLNQLEKAEKFAREIPDEEEQLSTLAQVRAYQRRFPEAANCLLELEQRFRRSGQDISIAAKIELASFAEKAGRTDVQNRIENDMRIHHLNEPDILNYFGYQWADRNTNLKQAEEYIRKALTADPENVAYLDSLAWLQYRQGKWDNAWKTIQQVIRLWSGNIPLDGEIASHTGDIAAARKDWENARKYWRLALRQNSYNIDKNELIRKLSEVPILPSNAEQKR